MRIIKIHIDGFGKLHDLDITPGSGITVLTGSNEAGKTTLHLFLRSILYGASTKRRVGMKSIYERMRPWHRPETYRGRIEVEHEQEQYVIERDFNKAADDLSIYRVGGAGAEAVEQPEALLKQILGGLSETAYINSVSSGQLGAATQKDMAAELRKYAANVSSTMHPGLSADKALRSLQSKKEELLLSLDEQAPKVYNTVLSEIKRLEAELELPENDNKIRLYDAAAKKAGEESEALSGDLAGQRAMIEQYKAELQEKGFGDEDDIHSTADMINLGYSRLKEAERKALSATPIVIAVLLLVLAVIAAVLAAVGGSFLPSVFRPVLIACAVVCAAAAIVLFVRQARQKSAWRADREELVGAMRQVIGECDADEAGIRRFNSYMDNAGKLSEEMNAVKRRARELEEKQGRLNDERSAYLENLELQHQTKSEVEGKLTRISRLRRQAAALQRMIRNNSLVRDQIEAVELAEDTISELEKDIRNATGTYINRAASEMIAAFTENAYDSISAGTNYDIQLNSRDGMIPVCDISAGTADQVYLAIRLATARFIAGENDPMPLVLDDSFNLYDDDRLKASLSFLTQSYKGQIMVFTCLDREKRALGELGVPFETVRI